MAVVELHFGSSNIRNGTSYVLDQYGTLIGNLHSVTQICLLQASMATVSALNHVHSP